MEASIAYLLDFASATRAGAPREEVATADIVRRIAGVMPYMHPETESVIETVTELPVVIYDRLQLERVFSNLIENAVKYARDGKVHVRVGAQREGGTWMFSVSDDGIGVPAGQEQRIFEIFARGTQTKNKAGHGLGLAICRKIVEDHGGRIGVEAVYGGGSRFYFTVPVTPKEITE
jgi:signal transduction histidine kinase